VPVSAPPLSLTLLSFLSSATFSATFYARCSTVSLSFPPPPALPPFLQIRSSFLPCHASLPLLPQLNTYSAIFFLVPIHLLFFLFRTMFFFPPNLGHLFHPCLDYASTSSLRAPEGVRCSTPSFLTAYLCS